MYQKKGEKKDDGDDDNEELELVSEIALDIVTSGIKWFVTGGMQVDELMKLWSEICLFGILTHSSNDCCNRNNIFELNIYWMQLVKFLFSSVLLLQGTCYLKV